MINEHLQNMINNVDNEYDKSEGSLFYDVLAPASIEIDETYKKAKYLFDMSNPLTAKGEYLDLAVKGRIGDRVARKKATKSIGKVEIRGKNNVVIEKGTKVACEDIVFETLNRVVIVDNKAICDVECIQDGTIGNLPAKTIKDFPITIQGLEEVINNEATKGGYETETDESFLERYLIAIREPATSGNIYHYKRWALEVQGVGAVKIFPLWNGNGTVKVVVTNNEMGVATTELISSVANHIETVRPIGATVTVESAKQKEVIVKATITLLNGYDLQTINVEFLSRLKDLYKQISFKQNYVSFGKVGELLLNTNGVAEYENLLLNEKAFNFKLEDNEIPYCQSVSISQKV